MCMAPCCVASRDGAAWWSIPVGAAPPGDGAAWCGVCPFPAMCMAPCCVANLDGAAGVLWRAVAAWCPPSMARRLAAASVLKARRSAVALARRGVAALAWRDVAAVPLRPHLAVIVAMARRCAAAVVRRDLVAALLSPLAWR